MDLFTLDAVKPRNKDIFIATVKSMPDGTIIKISPFTDHLRALGADLSEESTSRYLRFCRSKWNLGIDFEALGKGKYQLKKEG